MSREGELQRVPRTATAAFWANSASPGSSSDMHTASGQQCCQGAIGAFSQSHLGNVRMASPSTRPAPALPNGTHHNAVVADVSPRRCRLPCPLHARVNPDLGTQVSASPVCCCRYAAMGGRKRIDWGLEGSRTTTVMTVGTTITGQGNVGHVCVCVSASPAVLVVIIEHAVASHHQNHHPKPSLHPPVTPSYPWGKYYLPTPW